MVSHLSIRHFRAATVALLACGFLASCGGGGGSGGAGAGATGGSSSTSGSSPGGSQLVMDQVPSGISPSPQYTARVAQGGTAQTAFVYQIQNPGFLANGQPSGISSTSTLEQSTAWTSFSFAGSVTVQVTNHHPFTSARILPSHSQIAVTVQGDTVSFTLTHPGQFVVAFCDTGATCSEANDTDITNPMLVFANPIETALPTPSLPGVLSVSPGLSVPSGASAPVLTAEENTVFFGPGIYDLGLTPYTINSNQTVYLAPGAYVKGFFTFAPNATDAAIRGRGIVSGENLPKAQCIGTTSGCPDMVTSRGGAHLSVEGVTFIQSPFYNIQMVGGSGNTVNNVKVLAWLGNSDGIQASTGVNDTGSVIENSFVKNGDDSIKLTGSNLLVTGCVVWKLNNAAAFEMGAGVAVDLTNIRVQDSDVVRAEYSWPNTSNAVFSANQGGSGNLSGYTFDDIRIENETWQLFKIQVLPSNFQSSNATLGSIGSLSFSNIQATDAQKFAPIFRGYDLAHQVFNVSFSNVVVGGISTPSPVIGFDANRNMSYTGNTVSNLLFRSQQDPTSFDIPIFTLYTPASVPQYSLDPISQPNLVSGLSIVGSGDFFGDGFASAVAVNAANGQIGIWKEPYRQPQTPWSSAYAVVYTLANSDGAVAGVGDFNGDGYSDILLWNSATQAGKVLTMNGDQVMGTVAFQPATASNWTVAAVADFGGDGYSDVLLRDGSGNLEIVYFHGTSAPTTVDYPESTLYYGATAQYTATYGSTSGHLDASWTVVGAGIFQTLGPEYAGLIWLNPTTGQVAMTSFTPFESSTFSTQVFAVLPANTSIQALGDFNGDGAKDLLLWNSSTMQNLIWFTNFDNGARYSVGPTLSPSLPAGLQVAPH